MPQIVLDFDAIHAALDARGWPKAQLFEEMVRLGYDGSRSIVYHALSGYIAAPAPSMLWYMARALGMPIESLLTPEKAKRRKKS